MTIDDRQETGPSGLQSRHGTSIAAQPCPTAAARDDLERWTDLSLGEPWSCR
ncbi:hypothetical protein BKA81DRAFT_366612 [Phyllosticta paracitricarpa]